MKTRSTMAGVALTALASLWNPSVIEAEAVTTKVLVRAVSRDAKVTGDSVGGVRITLREAATGKVLAEGVQRGGSGDTERIMLQPRARGATVFDTPGTAGFLATVMLERPTMVEVVAEGPLDFPQARQRASKTLLLVPGEDILGEGLLLEIHGFIVELLAPPPDSTLAVGDQLRVRARVRMA